MTYRFVVPVRGVGDLLEGCLRAIRDSDAGAAPILVVFDGAPLASERAACSRHRADVMYSGGRGAGAARNAGARAVEDELIFFVDADVQIAPASPSRALGAMRAHAADAIAGAYTRTTVAPGAITRLKNLQHSYVHRTNAGPVASFWAGCALVSREAFVKAGGFDETLRYCEDIELGARLTRLGYRVVFDPVLEGTHAKTYTARSWMRSEVVERSLPWASLILARRAPPGTLNAGASGLAGVAVAALTVLGVALSPSWRKRGAVLAAGVAAESAVNAGFIRFVRDHDSTAWAGLAGPYLLGHYTLGAVGGALAFANHVRRSVTT